MIVAMLQADNLERGSMQQEEVAPGTEAQHDLHHLLAIVKNARQLSEN